MKTKTIRITLAIIVSLILSSTFYMCASAGFIKGDVDEDGFITASDARVTLRASVGLEILLSAQKDIVDIDNDGTITASDARMILRASVGLEKLPNMHIHNWGDWSINEQATVSTEGLKTRVCLSCNVTEQSVIEPLLRYKLLSNDEYAVEGFSDKSYDNLVIPETFNGKKVTVIASDAFTNQNIKSLTISKNINEIGAHAFKGCENLSEVNNISFVRVLAPTAFEGCTQLLIRIPSSITTNLTFDDTKKIYILESDVQIKNTATLCFTEGIVLNGANYSIKNYGTFNATGAENNKISFYNVKLLSCNVDNSPNTFSLQYVNYYSGSIFNPTGNSSHSGIYINNCSFYDCAKSEYAYIWYPVTCQIKNSYFENWSVLTIGTDENVTALIEGNTFVNCGSDLGYGENYNSVINCWAAYGNPVQVKNNTFINPFRYALSLKIDGKIDSIDNDFSVSEDKIHELIYDGDDDFGISNTVNIVL